MMLVLLVMLAGVEYPQRMSGWVPADQCEPISIALVSAGEKDGARVMRAECRVRDDRKDEA